MNSKKLLIQAVQAALLLPTTLTLAFAAEPATPAPADKDKAERIEVTGSRIKRTDTEGPSPVTVLTGEQMLAEGFATVSDALASLTEVFGSAQNELNSNGGFTPNASVVNLRALGPGRNLVLINGRRVADYPLPYNGQSNTVNLGSIPSAAIERVEVLSGGASAIYGSDAVAGVMNIILKKNYEGDAVSVKATQPTRGGGTSYDLKWAGGRTADRWSLTYALQHLERPMIQGIDRDFMDSWQDAPLTYPAVQPSSGLRVRNRNLSTTAANNYYFPGYTGDPCSNFKEYSPYTYTSTNTTTNVVTTLGPACAFNASAAYQAIRNSDEDNSAYLYGTWQITDKIEAFASVIAWQQTAESNTGVLSWESPVVYDAGYKNRLDIRRVFTPDEIGGKDGPGMIRIFEESTLDLAFGANGSFGDHDWTVNVSRSSNESSNDRPRLLQAAVENYFLGPKLGDFKVGSTLYPVHDIRESALYNPVTPTIWNGLTSNVHTEGDAEVTQASFVVSGDLFDLPAGPLSYAAVLEHSAQEYELRADQRIVPNADGTTKNIIYGLTGTGGGGERDRSAVGIELAVPIVSGLDAQLAARYDKYNDLTDVDDAVTYNIGLKWKPTENLLFRSMWATSFRAPDMHYVFADASGSFSTLRDDYLCRSSGIEYSKCTSSVQNYSMFTVSKGNVGLKEEEGESLSLGMVWDILDDLSLSLDWYKIEIDGMVARLDQDWILRKEAECKLGTNRDGATIDKANIACDYYLARVVRHADGADAGKVKNLFREPINRSYQSSEGVDAKLRHTLRTSNFGRFRTEFSWSHVLELQRKQFAVDPLESYRDKLDNFDFRSRTRLSVNWSYEDWSATLLARREGSLPNWAETGRIASFATWNASLAYRMNKNLTLGVNVSNLFDKIHPSDPTYNSYPFFWRAYSPIGREVGVEAQWRF